LFYFVPTPIGNLEDITCRALNILGSVETVFCEDSRVAKKLLQLLSLRYDIEPKTKRYIPLHEHNQKELLQNIDISIFDNDCCYISDAGMPSISDPGAYLINFLVKNGIEYDVLPGASAFSVAYSASGFESGKFIFYGFLPHKSQKRESEIASVCSKGIDVIFYEAPHRILKLLDEIKMQFPDNRLFVAKELTKKFQTYFKGNAAKIQEELKKSSIKGEWCVVFEANSTQISQNQISKEDIMALDIPKKVKAKLLSKISSKSVKEWYSELLDL
jgi:16S rRNA (cytidine1402-2'-O)-methyltransferase